MFANSETELQSQDVQPKALLPFSAYTLWMPVPSWYETGKDIADAVIAGAILFLTAPVIGLAALLVKLTSSGPAFYTQTRVGRYGKLYTIYKLRSMHHNCERHSGARWSTSGDPRVTRVGRFLRRTHIDELPQLWNVIKGEMSLVGPRPERPEFLPQLEQVIPHYRCRLLVRPGLTGLAQVQLPPDSDLDSVRRKLAYDLHYVKCHSPMMDLSLLVATVMYLLRLPASTMRAVLGLPGGELIERAYELTATRRRVPASVPVSLENSRRKTAPAVVAACT